MSELQLDELTGVHSHRVLSREVEPNGCGFLVDGDGHIWVNDQGGHTSGDRALKQIADALSRLVPRNVFRVGGDEFLVAPPRANLAETLSIAAEAIESIRALNIPYCRTQPSRVRLEVNAVVYQLDANILLSGIGSIGMTPELRDWFGELVDDLKTNHGNQAGVLVDAHTRHWLSTSASGHHDLSEEKVTEWDVSRI